jgi:hypothetical protein
MCLCQPGAFSLGSRSKMGRESHERLMKQLSELRLGRADDRTPTSIPVAGISVASPPMLLRVYRAMTSVSPSIAPADNVTTRTRECHGGRQAKVEMSGRWHGSRRQMTRLGQLGKVAAGTRWTGRDTTHASASRTRLDGGTSGAGGRQRNRRQSGSGRSGITVTLPEWTGITGFAA